MTVDIDRKIDLLRERVLSLSLSDSIIPQTELMIKKSGLPTSTAESLRKEWLNDMLSHPSSAETRHATSDPSDHFLKWLEERVKHRYHVSRRTVSAIANNYSPEIASKLSIIIWPQEIAWAQRMRLDKNPFTATKAALFLRDIESNPSKVFISIAGIYSDAVMTNGYLDNEVQDFTADEIRFAVNIPEFAPLFQRYAARAYSDALKAMSRDQLKKYASRAADDENNDRRRIASENISRRNTRFPMRYSISIIRSAIAFKLDANKLFLLEKAFNRLLENGEVDVEPGMVTADAGFLKLLANKDRRTSILDMEELPPAADCRTAWDIIHLNAGFSIKMPGGLVSLKVSKDQFSQWQEDVVEGKRPLPYDEYSDIGFFLLGSQ